MGEGRLCVTALNAGYGRAQILHGVTLAVEPGQAVVLLGRNGAGKSTTLKAIIGLVRPTRGQVTFDGCDITGAEPFRVARLGIGYVPEERRIFPGLSVRENLDTGVRPPRPGLAAWTRERVYDLFPALATLQDRPGGQLSGGEQQMLAVARTLMGNPRTLLLDEPNEGLAPKVTQQMEAAILRLKAEGVGMVLAEQNLRFARRVAESAVLIEGGRTVWSGSVAALAADGALQARYLAV